MSFLAGRLAGKEAAFFFEESKHAVGRLVEKSGKPSLSSSSPPVTASAAGAGDSSADVLPEVLRHSLPAKVFRYQLPESSSLSNASKWSIESEKNGNFSTVSPDVLNPLRGYLSLPQVTFGPKRWQLPTTENSVTASTANELRHDQYTHVNSEKVKAAAEGLAQIGKAFAVATACIFGGAALTFGFAVSKLDLHNSEDVRTKGQDLIQPKFETIRDQLSPLRTWVEKTSKKWQVKVEQDVKEKPLIKELSKIFGAKSSS